MKLGAGARGGVGSNWTAGGVDVYCGLQQRFQEQGLEFRDLESTEWLNHAQKHPEWESTAPLERMQKSWTTLVSKATRRSPLLFSTTSAD